MDKKEKEVSLSGVMDEADKDDDDKEDNSQTIEIPLEHFNSADISEQNIEKLAQGYFIGKTAVGRKKDVRKILEDRVVNKIGSKGKYLVGKLFELIDGVYMVDKTGTVGGKKEIKYYKVPPNLNAIVYALDRVLGKPKQVNITGSFSLSQLLIKTDGRPEPSRIRSGNNEEVSEKPDLFY